MLTAPLRTPLTWLPAEHHAEAVSIFKLVRGLAMRPGCEAPSAVFLGPPQAQLMSSTSLLRRSNFYVCREI